jgi:chromosome segregation ATPase
MSSNYLQIGQTTSVNVQRAGASPAPITISNTSPPPLPLVIGSNTLQPSISSPSYNTSPPIVLTSSPTTQPYSSTYIASSVGVPPTTSGKSAKDFLLGNNLEGKAEMQNMRKSQQVYLQNLPSASAMRDEIGGQKFESRITNPGRDIGMHQSSYVGRDTMGSNPSSYQAMMSEMKFNNFQYIAELERNVAELRMESNNNKRQAASTERQISQLTKELEYLQDENGRLRTDLHKFEQLRAQLEEVTLELERMKADRDFHNEQHLNLRKEMLEIVKQEYEIESLRREKVFLDGELKNYKEKAVIYEKQIDELTILAKRPVSKGANIDGSDKQDHYYAKKILELETKLKDMKKSNDELRHENATYKAGIKDDLNVSKLTDVNFRATTPDSLLEQVNLLKKKNESLKKENEIIRRELKNQNGGPSDGVRQSGFDANADNRIKELQKQIEQLTRKNLKLEEDMMIGGGGATGSSIEVMELRMKLDEANRQIAKLKTQASTGSFMQEKPSSDYAEKMQRMIADYLDQINHLRQENEELKSGLGASAGFGGGANDARVNKLRSENEELRIERDALRQKVQDLQSKLEFKEKEIDLLKSSTVPGADNEGLIRLMETNQRLVGEIAKLQENMRKMESSMNMSLTQGGNNSMLNPYSQFMMP